MNKESPGRMGAICPDSLCSFLQPALPGSRDNCFDYFGFGVGVVLHILPVATGEVAFGDLVEQAVGIVGAQPVAEEQHTLDFRAVRGEDMQVDVGVWSLEQTMLVPIWFAYAQHIASGLQRWNIGCFVR